MPQKKTEIITMTALILGTTVLILYGSLKKNPNELTAIKPDWIGPPVSEAILMELEPSDSELMVSVAIHSDSTVKNEPEEKISFGEAFAEARQKLGPGATFTWNGIKYTTFYSEEIQDSFPDSTNLDLAMEKIQK